MASFNELLQDMVNKDYSELVYIAKQATVGLMPACKAVDSDHGGYMMLTSLILTAVAADGVLTALERKMIGDTYSFDSDTIDKMIAMYDKRMADLADHFVDNMGTETKAHALALITAFAAVDEKISKEETRLLRKLLD